MVWVDVEIIAGPNQLVGKSASIQLKETNEQFTYPYRHCIRRWDRDIGRVEILRMFGEFDDLRRISRSHFSISYNIEDAMIVRDAGSSNGTKMLDGVYDGPGPINIELSGFLHLRLSFSNQEYSNAIDGIVADTRTSASDVVVPKQLSDREFFDYITSEVENLCNEFGLTYQIGKSRPGGWQFGGMGGLLHSDPYEEGANQKIDNTVWKIRLDDENVTGWEKAGYNDEDEVVWEKRIPRLSTKCAVIKNPLTKWQFEGDYYLLAFKDAHLVFQHSGYFAGDFNHIFFTSHYTMLQIGTPRIVKRKLIFGHGEEISLGFWLSHQIGKFPPNIFRVT